MKGYMERSALEVAQEREQRQEYRQEVQKLLKGTGPRQSLSTDRIPEDMEVSAHQLVDYLRHAAATRELERSYFSGAPEPAGTHIRRLAEADARAYLLEEKVLTADTDDALAEAVTDRLLVIRHDYEKNEDAARHHSSVKERNKRLSDLAYNLIKSSTDLLGAGVIEHLVKADGRSEFIRKMFRRAMAR